MKTYKYNNFWQFWWLILAAMEIYNICLEIKSARTSVIFVPVVLLIISAVAFYKFRQPYIELEDDHLTIQVPITLGFKVQNFQLSKIPSLKETKIGVEFDYPGGENRISLNLTLVNAGDRKRFIEDVEKAMKKQKSFRNNHRHHRAQEV
jgi:hypothetical protein